MPPIRPAKIQNTEENYEWTGTFNKLFTPTHYYKSLLKKCAIQSIIVCFISLISLVGLTLFAKTHPSTMASVTILLQMQLTFFLFAGIIAFNLIELITLFISKTIAKERIILDQEAISFNNQRGEVLCYSYYNTIPLHTINYVRFTRNKKSVTIHFYLTSWKNTLTLQRSFSLQPQIANNVLTTLENHKIICMPNLKLQTAI